MSSATLDGTREAILDISLMALPPKSSKAVSFTDINTLVSEVANSVSCLIRYESYVERIITNWNSDWSLWKAIPLVRV